MSYIRQIRHGLGMGLALLVAIVVAVLPSSASAAEFGIVDFDGEVAKPDGSPDSQAGAAPWRAFGTARFNVDDAPDPLYGKYRPAESARHIYLDLPPGFVGNPEAVPKCSSWEAFGTPGLLDGVQLNSANCQVASQVGAIAIQGPVGHIPPFGSSPSDPHGLPSWFALYNMEPPPGKVAAFAANIVGIPVVLTAEVRPDDYGVRVSVENINQGAAFLVAGMSIWGVPGDRSHDMVRYGYRGIEPVQSLKQGGGQPEPTTEYPGDPSRAVSAGVAPRAFLRNPTACTPEGVGLETRMRAVSWGGSEDWASFFTHYPAPSEDRQIGPTGCDRLPFDPDLVGGPRTGEAGAPAGFDFEITVPQVDNPGGIGQADLKRAVVTLPEGVAISPSSADGLDACTDAELRVGVDGPARCPAGSKIGTVAVETPLLDKTLTGSVYVRSQRSSDPASGEMFRIAIEIRDDERGIYIKLPGSVRVDPGTGRIQTEFDNNPQVPFSKLRIELKGGARAPLVTPEACGTHRITAELTSWGGQVRELTAPFTLDEGCAPRGFSPGFTAGAVTPAGGAFSPLVARIQRGDDQQFLSGVEVDLPEGLLASLRGVPLCSGAAAANGGCPAGSRIGTATVGAGPGSSPFYLSGDVFLTEGYRGGPYGLAVHVHAKAGPFDLGWVRVRQALYVDPETAEVSVVSDPLPQIVKGVPVRLRDVRVDVDRPDFTVNPTSCEEQAVDATLTSIQGAVHRTGTRFQVGDCASLGFRPRLGMRLFGPKQRRTGGHPALKAIVRQADGQANVRKARVVLPRSIALDADNSSDPEMLCDYDAAVQRAECPQSSVIGRARAVTPVLNRPLTGPVHMVQGIKVAKQTGNRIRTTPHLLVKLDGEVQINLRAKTTAKNGLLVTRFLTVPDAPVSRFAMRIKGGNKGILTVTRTRQSKIDLCDDRQTARVRMHGHNDRNARFKTRVRTPCGKKGRKAQRRAKANRRAQLAKRHRAQARRGPDRQAR